jgi:alpha-mannosidase
VPRVREVLVIPHTHHDVGYTDSPRTLLDLHWRAVGEAIRLASATVVDPSSAFRWSFETARPVLQFLDRSGADDIAALVRCAREGRISVTGGYLNGTQLAGHEELTRSFDGVGRLRRAGLPVRVVQHSDINGLPWGTVSAMARAGLDVLVMALNPDHGRPPFEQPRAFWWEGPDGSRVLVWLSLHYGLAETWGLLDGDIDGVADGLFPVVRRLEARTDYPFDFVVLHAADDNGWPTRHAADGVAEWNRRHPELPMTTSTLDAAMVRALQQAGAAPIPVWRGEWADWWAHGHGSSALEVGVARRARTMLRAAETAFALDRLGGAPTPPTERRTAWRRDPVRARGAEELAEAIAATWDSLLLFEEHTWGADESVSAPTSDFTRSHWSAKASLAYAAYDGARDLLREGMWRLGGTPAADGGRSVLVFNPGAATRSGAVEVEVDVDGTTQVVRARDVPGLGVARLPLPPPEHIVSEAGRVLETAGYRIEVDPARGGIISLLDRALGWELVDPLGAHPIGALLVEAVDPSVDHPVVTSGRRHFGPGTPGPSFARARATGTAMPVIRRGEGWASISWLASAPTVPEVRTTVTVNDLVPSISLSVELDKDEVLEVEGVYVAFPFNLAAPEFLLETAGAVFEAGREQLPDTCRDWYSVQHAVAVNGQDRHVMWTTHEAPLVQLGEIHTGEWARELRADAGHVYAWLMNNLYFTNFRASQGGHMRFDFDIEPRTGRADHDAVRIAGEAAGMPMVARVVQGGARSATSAPLALVAEGLVAATLSPLADPDFASLRLVGGASGPTRVTIAWSGDGRLRAWRADVFGQPIVEVEGDGRAFAIELGPAGLSTIVLERADERREPARG